MMMNRLLIGLTLVAITTGINVYNNQDNYSGKTEFERYGFSFLYPGNMMILESGFPDFGSGASDFSGCFQGTIVIGERIEQIQVVWKVVQEYDTLEEALISLYEDVTNDSTITINYLSEIDAYENIEFTYKFLYFEADQEGLSFNAIIGITIIPWESLRSNRGYCIIYLATEGVYNESELKSTYIRFLSSFKPAN